MDPPFRDCRHFWCPQLGSPTLFWYVAENMEEEIYRFPAVLDTDEFFFQETENESQQTEANTDDGMMTDEWFGAMNPVDSGQFWEMPEESWLTDTNREASWEGSETEEWGRPPQINTMGLEWFYE